MLQRLQQVPILLRILAYAAAGVALLALAVGVGVMAALTLGPDRDSPQGVESERAGEANPGQGGRSEDARKGASDAEGAREGASDTLSGAAYSNKVARIQNGSVDASLQSNDKLLRYDTLTAEDVEKMKANHVALQDYARRARDLAPPAEHEGQHRVFVLAISELREADELAYLLAVNPSSATQAGFEAYDRHVDRATAYLSRSNEMLGENYKTTKAAREVSLG